MEKLFVTRVDSLVGANAVAVLSDRLEVVAAPPGATVDAVCDAVRRERPQWVWHSGPAAWSSWDREGVAGARSTAAADLAEEATILRSLIAACGEAGARLAVVTSDALFCGPRMFHEEDGPSRTSTPTAKALQKLEGALCSAGALVLRSHVYGWMPAGGATNYAERMLHALTSELPCKVDARRHATPILATDFVQTAYEACRAGLAGLFHLAGAERTSPHRFAAELAATLGVPGCNVRLEPSDEGTRARRLDETSLNVGALRNRLNRPLPMLREGLSRFVDQAFNGYRDRLQPATASELRNAATLPMASAA